MKSELRIMDPEHGDVATEWDPAVESEVAIARSAFETAVQKRNTVFYEVTRDGENGRVINDFNPDAERIIGVPLAVGG